MDDRTDILYVGFLLGHGGDAVQMLELATGMARRGHKVKVVVPRLESSVVFGDWCDQRGIPYERSEWIHSHDIAARQNVFNLVRFFRSQRAPILHLHTGDVCLPRSVLLVMQMLRLPRAFATIQSPYDTMSEDVVRCRHWSLSVSRQFHKVICPSEHSRRTQIGYGVPQDRLQTIYNSVDVRRFACGDAQAARRSVGADDRTRWIVFSSRLDQQKRPLDALEAFRRVAGEFPDVQMVFVGSGALETQLQAEAQRAGLAARTHFVGFQSNIPDWLAAASVWLFPTESENFSLAVLEALAAGCPIVSTSCPGNDEVLEDGKNALLTAVGNVEEQAAALRRLLSDESPAERLRAGARQTAQRYSTERMAADYAACYAAAPAGVPSQRHLMEHVSRTARHAAEPVIPNAERPAAMPPLAVAREHDPAILQPEPADHPA